MIRFKVFGQEGEYSNGKWSHPDRRVVAALEEKASRTSDYEWGPDPEFLHVQEVIEEFAGKITDLSKHKAPPPTEAPDNAVF